MLGTRDRERTTGRRIACWTTTGLAALAIAASGAADLLKVPAVIDGLTRLGYPPYLTSILGAWKLLGAAAIVLPGLPRLKEWAYAGMVFAFTGAAASHGLSGDSAMHTLPSLVLLGVVVTSWALRTGTRGDVLITRASGHADRRRVA
jgi:uncharacterized membrane protein YphA (DoxX/SURF4 family)